MKEKFIHVIAVFIEGELSYVQTFDSLATAELFIDSLPIKLQNQISDVPITDSLFVHCLLYTSPSPRDNRVSRMPSSA